MKSWPLTVAACALCVATAIQAAPVNPLVDPADNFDAVINGVFALCPALVLKQAEFPDDVTAKPLGWKPATSQREPEKRLDGMFGEGIMQLRYDTEKNSCVVHISGGGYQPIAGAVRDTISQQEPAFRNLITDSSKDRTSNVFVRDDKNGNGLEQFIVVEDSTSETTSIDFRLKAKL
jgi:hypothetical protein